MESLREFAEQWRTLLQRVNPWLILVVVLGLYLLSGLFIVAPAERGVILRFGRAVRDTGPGPHYHIPWPVEQVWKVPVTQVRKAEIGFRTISMSPARLGAVRAMVRTLDAEALGAYLDTLLNSGAHSLRRSLTAYARDHGTAI